MTIRCTIAAIPLAMALSAAQGGGPALATKNTTEWLKKQENGDWLFDNGYYLVRFAKRHGFAGVEVRILAATGNRLDQYWTPDLTFSPMCRFFDNLSFTGSDTAEIQGFVTMDNAFVEAEATKVNNQPALLQKGYLQVRRDQTKGQVYFEKTLVFYPDRYDVSLLVRVPPGSTYRYADVWWDVNDDWSNRYSNSAGHCIALRNRVADCPSPKGPEAFLRCAALDRGYGVWMTVSGEHEEILVSTSDATFKSLPNSGMGFFDGDNETDDPKDKYTSHSCLALGLCDGGTKPKPFPGSTLRIAYSVFFIARSTYAKLYEPFRDE